MHCGGNDNPRSKKSLKYLPEVSNLLKHRLPMNQITTTSSNKQSLAVEEFLYFFLRMRKNEVKRTVKVLKESYPAESPDEIAKRLINAKTGLSLFGGTLLSLPGLMPGWGQALKLAGFVGAGSMLTRMHLYLLLEVGLAYDHDPDDTARVPEMAAIVAATGLSAAASPILVSRLKLDPIYSLPAGALTMATLTRLIGFTGMKYYGSKRSSASEFPASLATAAR